MAYSKFEFSMNLYVGFLSITWQILYIILSTFQSCEYITTRVFEYDLIIYHPPGCVVSLSALECHEYRRSTWPLTNTIYLLMCTSAIQVPNALEYITPLGT